MIYPWRPESGCRAEPHCVGHANEFSPAHLDGQAAVRLESHGTLVARACVGGPSSRTSRPTLTRPSAAISFIRGARRSCARRWAERRANGHTRTIQREPRPQARHRASRWHPSGHRSSRVRWSSRLRPARAARLRERAQGLPSAPSDRAGARMGARRDLHDSARIAAYAAHVAARMSSGAAWIARAPFDASDVPLVACLSRGACSSRASQLTAFFTSAPILASSAAVNSVSAKATGHM